MANFDALRSAIIGPLEYICKPSPPAELIGCWPLMTGGDKSRYGGTVYPPASATAITTKSNGTTLPYTAIRVDANSSISYYLGQSLDMSQDWSLDYFDVRYTGDSYTHCITSIGSLTATTYEPGVSTNGIYFNSTRVCAMDNDFFVALPYFHFAMVYRSASKKLICFINGLTKSAYQGSLDLSGASFVTAVSQQIGNKQYAIANLRVCQKAVGTTTTFPVPTSLYTGYEAL